jgi:hypothetical protein
MTAQHRPSLLRRLLAWRATTRPAASDPADMGTEIGLAFILAAQPAGQRTAAKPGPGRAPGQPWQAWPQ